MSKKCPDCSRPLGIHAIKCGCGWKESQAVSVPTINCGFSSCLSGAIARVWTRGGWLNVCPEHHKTVEIIPRVTSNPVCDEIRARYAKSHAYGKKNGPNLGTQIPNLGREPGEDDGSPLMLPTDPLEVEFQA